MGSGILTSEAIAESDQVAAATGRGDLHRSGADPLRVTRQHHDGTVIQVVPARGFGITDTPVRASAPQATPPSVASKPPSFTRFPIADLSLPSDSSVYATLCYGMANS